MAKNLKDMMPYRAYCAYKKVHKKQACSKDAMNAHRNFSWVLLCPLKKNQQLHIVSNGIPFIVMQMWTLIFESWDAMVCWYFPFYMPWINFTICLRMSPSWKNYQKLCSSISINPKKIRKKPLKLKHGINLHI